MLRLLVAVLAASLFVSCQGPDPLADSTIVPPPNPPERGNWKYRGDSLTFAQRSPVYSNLSPPGQHALLVLANAAGFTTEALGPGGTLSPHARAFRELLADTQAIQAFRELAQSASIPARLYGLSGLYLLAPSEYRAHAAPLRRSNHVVATQSGCIVMDRTAGEIIGTGDPTRWEIESGLWPKALAGRPY